MIKKTLSIILSLLLLFSLTTRGRKGRTETFMTPTVCWAIRSIISHSLLTIIFRESG